jgi:hypothetical protein
VRAWEFTEGIILNTFQTLKPQKALYVSPVGEPGDTLRH